MNHLHHLPTFAELDDQHSANRADTALRSETAEVAVLSILMAFPDAYDSVSENLKPELFTTGNHKALFTVVRREIGAGKHPDVVTVAEAMNGRMTLPQVHAIATSHDHSAKGMKGMVDLLVERHKSRELHRIAAKLSEAAFDTDKPAQERIDTALADLQKLEEVASSDDWVDSEEAVIDHMRILEKRENGEVRGIPTGLDDLDEVLDGGMQRGNLVVIGARPSMGKAQPLSAKVLTAAGWVKMGDLTVGDSLASIDGQQSIVTGVFPQGQKQTFRVTFSDGRTTECCDEHLWSVHYRRWASPKVLSTGEVRQLMANPSMEGRLWIDSVTGDFGKSGGDLPLNSWLLGALLGDGDLTQKTIRFSKTNEQMLDMVRDRLPAGVQLIHAGGCDWRLSGEKYRDASGAWVANSNPLTQIERQASGFSPRFERTGRDGLLGGKLPSVATTVPNSSFAIRQLEPSTKISGNSPSRMGVREVGALLNESAQADAVGHGRPVEGIPAINGGEDVNSVIRDMGLMGCSSATKFIPEAYKNAEREVRLNVLRGLMDTDGWVEKHGSVLFSSASKQLAMDAQGLARSLGYWCSMREKATGYKKDGKHHSCLTAYVLTISGGDTSELFLSDAKRDRCSSKTRVKRVAFSKIEVSSKTLCQCISVSHPTHLYITDDYVVTHNTALGMTIGLHAAQHHAVAMLSMEMPHADLRDRQLAILGRIPLSHLKRPKLHGLDYGRVVDAVERSKTLRFFASDKSGLNILQVRSKARTIKRKRGLDVLVVDYIGLMAGLNPKDSRAYQIEEISRGLKALAKELDIVVICLAQVNRGAMDRTNTTPGLHDLRDSGAIEQDADVVAFIHRPIVANPQAGEQFAHYALVRVAKNRQGRTADVHCHYHGECTRFSSWAGDAPVAQTGGRTGSGKKGFGHDD